MYCYVCAAVCVCVAMSEVVAVFAHVKCAFAALAKLQNHLILFPFLDAFAPLHNFLGRNINHNAV